MLETSLVYTFVKKMDMPAYHTLHVLQDVQIENQHEKNQNTSTHLVHYYIITRSTHFKRADRIHA